MKCLALQDLFWIFKEHLRTPEVRAKFLKLLPVCAQHGGIVWQCPQSLSLDLEPDGRVADLDKRYRTRRAGSCGILSHPAIGQEDAIGGV